MVDRLARLVAWADPATVVLAGDVVHAFDHVSEAVGEAFTALTDAVGAAGNHDGRLDALCDPVDALSLPDGTVVCHGHEPPEATGDRYVIGHDHPAIELEGRRHPCLLYAEAGYRGAPVLALPAFTPLALPAFTPLAIPAFTPLARGTAVNRLEGGDLASPLLDALDGFAPGVRDEAADATYVFPDLAAVRPYLTRGR